MLVTVLTGENGSTAGGADRISDKAAVETNSFPSQPVQVRRLNKTTTVGANSLAGVVIRQDENNVRPGTLPSAGNGRENLRQA
jgi:hypothetical protein